MLEVASLGAQRGELPLFEGLTLKLTPGTLLHVTGPNGLGKTTFLRLLLGLLRPASGRITWNNEDTFMRPEGFRRAVLWLGHAPGVDPLCSPLENLAWAQAMGKDPWCARKAKTALGKIGLNSQAHWPCATLSEGQKRRVALARLWLCSHRPLWILDEPFNALDTVATADLAALLETHATQGGIVVLTSHHAPPFHTSATPLDLEAFAC